jgi:DNA-binding NtrC family response regulator
MESELYIICVDDEKIVLDSLNAQLTRNFGNTYNYEFAESAEEALEVIEDLSQSDNEVIFVIISDWLMPGMKGDELLEKAKQRVSEVKTILLTGHVDVNLLSDIQKRANGQIQTIYKPWSEEKLISLITDK